MPTEPRYHAVIVGGSFAGMAAGLQLARARRRVLVLDAGVRRNRFAATSHGFLGQDGRAPGEIVAEGRAQLLAYPTVTWVDGAAASARQAGEGFVTETEAGQTVESELLILATGVIDELPAVPGLAERWGQHVFHCPYCHGYELDQGRIGVIGTGPFSLHQAQMLPHWGTVTLFTNGVVPLDAEQSADLARRGVTIEPTPIAAIVDAATVQLADGRLVPMDGLFAACRTRVAGPLAAQLGCAFEEGPLGAFIRTDEMKQTTVSGVFACGDAARAAGSVSFAVADGVMAGTAAHRKLLFG